MPYALGNTVLDPSTFLVDEFGNPVTDDGIPLQTPEVVLTPGTGGGGDQGLPAPSFTPESPHAAPQILPTIVATGTPPAAGVPWGLLGLLVIGGLALASGKGRGTREF